MEKIRNARELGPQAIKSNNYFTCQIEKSKQPHLRVLLIEITDGIRRERKRTQFQKGPLCHRGSDPLQKEIYLDDGYHELSLHSSSLADL